MPIPSLIEPHCLQGGEEKSARSRPLAVFAGSVSKAERIPRQSEPIRIQNAFGAMAHVRVTCDYNLHSVGRSIRAVYRCAARRGWDRHADRLCCRSIVLALVRASIAIVIVSLNVPIDDRLAENRDYARYD